MLSSENMTLMVMPLSAAAGISYLKPEFSGTRNQVFPPEGVSSNEHVPLLSVITRVIDSPMLFTTSASHLTGYPYLFTARTPIFEGMPLTMLPPSGKKLTCEGCSSTYFREVPKSR